MDSLKLTLKVKREIFIEIGLENDGTLPALSSSPWLQVVVLSNWNLSFTPTTLTSLIIHSCAHIG